MKFAGFYNFGGGGTETVTGVTNKNLPSFEENVCNNDKMLFSGQFSNLSRVLIHVTLRGFGTAQAMHRHDIRPYESLNVTNIPLSSIAIHVPTGETIGFHGMGSLFQTEDEDEYAVAISKSGLQEDLHNSPNFDTDDYTRTTITTATTTTLRDSGDDDFSVYKCTVASSGACEVDLIWTDSSNANIKYIGKLIFGGTGSFVYDFDPSNLRNPHRQTGKLRAITNNTATVTIDTIGHLVHEGQ
jgi:hypothetical protein